jgi:hypothetical protein
MYRFLLSLLLVLPAQGAPAQGADVGLINMVSADVSYAPAVGLPGKVQAFMKLRDGDRVNVPAGGQVRVVYFESARQERWAGPASFRAGKTAGEPISGKPAEVATLPAGAAQRIAQVPQLVQLAKLGGIQVRGMTRAQKASMEQQAAVGEARATYEKMRKDLPADDITPELYLFAALHDYLLYGEMKTVAQEMLRKQPGNEEVKSLADWVRSKSAR